MRVPVFERNVKVLHQSASHSELFQVTYICVRVIFEKSDTSVILEHYARTLRTLLADAYDEDDFRSHHVTIAS